MASVLLNFLLFFYAINSKNIVNFSGLQEGNFQIFPILPTTRAKFFFISPINQGHMHKHTHIHTRTHTHTHTQQQQNMLFFAKIYNSMKLDSLLK